MNKSSERIVEVSDKGSRVFMNGVSLQEIISRGRFIFSAAPRRFEVFKLMDGKRTAKEIARKVGRSQNAVLNDIKKLRDFGLVVEKRDRDDNPIKKDGSVVFEKSSLAKHIPDSYFIGVANTRVLAKAKISASKGRTSSSTKIHVPDEQEILDICREEENQLYEFKGPGIKMDKIAKEIAALLHTRNGGIILYGVEDDGSIIGSDLSYQEFDQRVQNSARNCITPPPNVQIAKRTVLGSEILLIIIQPWDRSTFYQYRDGRFYIRKGTNVFALKPEEMKKLSRGKYVV